MLKLKKEKIITFLLVTSVACFRFCNGIKLNLTESCNPSHTTICVLFDIPTSYEDPLFIANSSESGIGELIIRDTVLVRFPHEILKYALNLHTFTMYNCGLNRISSYDFEYAAALRTLTLQRNRLSEITEKVFTSLPLLEELRLGRNNIHMVHQLAFDGLKQLVHLDLHHNAIHQLSGREFSPLINLTYLDLSDNEISKIDSSTFATNTKLETLLLNNNKFVVFEPNSLEHLQHLYLLDIRNCFVEEIHIQSVDTFYAQNNSLNQCSIASVIKFHASNNELKELNLTDGDSVRELELHGNLFESLDPFVDMKNLQYLDLSKNHISTLGRSPELLSFPSLNYLNLAFNKLKNVTMDNFLNLPRLTHLDVAFNNLANLKAEVFDPLNRLEKLYIEGNGVHFFDFKKLVETHPLMKELGLSSSPVDTRQVHEMVDFWDMIDMYQHLNTAASTSTHQDVCECSSSHGEILALVTFLFVFLIFVLEVFRILQLKTCTSFFWRRSSLRLGQQWQSELLDETISEV